jgi:CYTH domain-containing protein
MAKEIEYKYLVDKSQWAKLEKPAPELIIQGFLTKGENLVVRVRIKGTKGYLTIKGKTVGITRTEYEYEIPLEDAHELIEGFTDKRIRKYRYEIDHDGMTWEVDVFQDKLDGLILAEIEVDDEDTLFSKPAWVTTNVSEDPEYYNAVLIDRC